MMTEYSNLNNKIRGQDFHGSICSFKDQHGINSYAYSENLLAGSNVNSESYYNGSAQNLNNSASANPNNSTGLINGQYQYGELMGQVNPSERENLIFSSFYNVSNIQHPSQNDFITHQQQQQQQNINYINSNTSNMRLNSNTNGYAFNTSPSNISLPHSAIFETQSAWGHFGNESQLKKPSLEIIGTFFYKYFIKINAVIKWSSFFYQKTAQTCPGSILVHIFFS